MVREIMRDENLLTWIIVFNNEVSYMVMFNLEIIKKSASYEAEKGCLSLNGIWKAMR